MLTCLAVHSVVFWIGDLNYRISDIDSEDCKQMITKGQLQDLLKKNDQVFVLFCKNCLLFWPCSCGSVETMQLRFVISKIIPPPVR